MFHSFRTPLTHFCTAARSNQERAILYTRQLLESYVVENWKPKFVVPQCVFCRCVDCNFSVFGKINAECYFQFAVSNCICDAEHYVTAADGTLYRAESCRFTIRTGSWYVNVHSCCASHFFYAKRKPQSSLFAAVPVPKLHGLISVPVVPWWNTKLSVRAKRKIATCSWTAERHICRFNPTQ